MTIQGDEKLIIPIIAENCVKYYAHNDELFKILHETHLSTGHSGENRMEYEINKKYNNYLFLIEVDISRAGPNCQGNLYSTRYSRLPVTYTLHWLQ